MKLLVTAIRKIFPKKATPAYIYKCDGCGFKEKLKENLGKRFKTVCHTCGTAYKTRINAIMETD